MELGQVVYSIRGRDSGRFYVVVEKVDSDFVKIADGKLRRIKSPKLKKIKHLKTRGEVLDMIGGELGSNVQVFDTELKSALRSFNEQV